LMVAVPGIEPGFHG